MIQVFWYFHKEFQGMSFFDESFPRNHHGCFEEPSPILQRVSSLQEFAALYGVPSCTIDGVRLPAAATSHALDWPHMPTRTHVPCTQAQIVWCTTHFGICLVGLISKSRAPGTHAWLTMITVDTTSFPRAQSSWHYLLLHASALHTNPVVQLYCTRLVPGSRPSAPCPMENKCCSGSALTFSIGMIPIAPVTHLPFDNIRFRDPGGLVGMGRAFERVGVSAWGTKITTSRFRYSVLFAPTVEISAVHELQFSHAKLAESLLNPAKVPKGSHARGPWYYHLKNAEKRVRAHPEQDQFSLDTVLLMMIVM